MRAVLGGALLAAGLGLAPRQAVAQIEGIGVLGGVSFASFGGTNSDAFNTNTGWLAGGFVQIDFGGMVGLRPELMYVQKGAARNITPSTTYTIEYFEIPVLVTVSLPMQGVLSVDFFAGPQMSVLSKCRAANQGGASGIPCATAGLPVASTDWGLVFGAELTINMFLVGVRYDLGLSNLSDDPNLNLKNQALMLTGGVLFRIPG